MSLPRFGVRNPVVSNLLMFVIIAAGLIFGLKLRREFFPEVRPNQVLIAAPYPGAAPDEIERSLTIKIEDAVTDLTGVDEVTSVVSEGLTSVTVEMEEGIPIDVAVADVKRAVDALQDLPEEAERITVEKLEPSLPVIIVKLWGDADERVLKSAMQQMRDDLRSLPEMGDVVLNGVRTDEISVELRPSAMLEHGLSVTEVSDRIRAGMVELPGGTVRSTTSNIAIRTVGAQDEAEAVRNIVVRSRTGGRPVLVRDVAEVSEGFEDVDNKQRFNGKPSVALTVVKRGDEDIVVMSEQIKAYVAGRTGEPMALTTKERLLELLRRPGDTGPLNSRWEAYQLGLDRSQTTPLPGTLSTTTDLARFVTGRLELLTRNALMGGVLVFAVLVLLLNWRVSFWVAIGLGVSLLGTLAMMHFVGITLNLLSMFGLIVVIGLLVDDAIVVAENITARHEQGEPADLAAIKGTNQVAWPVVSTVLTSIFAFLPLGLIEGQIGDFLTALPWVVACALSVSLLEALIILPCHMAHSLKTLDTKHERAGVFQRLEFRYDDLRDGLLQRRLIPAYVRLLGLTLRHRYLSMAVALSVLVVSLGMVAGGRLSFIFFEDNDAEDVNATLRMPIGTPVERTDAIVQRLEAAARAQPEVRAINAQIGAIFELDNAAPAQFQSHVAQVIFELAPVEEREALGQRASPDVILAIREAVGELTGVKSLRIQGVTGGPDGPAITLTVTGEDQRTLKAVADEVRHRLEEFEGVYDVSDDLDLGQRELRIELRDGATELGFTTATLARQVQGAVFGLEAHTFPGEREDVDVRVKLPREERRSLASIERMNVFTPDGRAVPLPEVARVWEENGYATLRRLDGRRAVTVTAEVDRTKAITEEVMVQFRPVMREIQAAHPDVLILERGRQQEMADSFSTLPVGMLTAFGLIYVVLAWLFRSYIQPIIVMTAIPFASVGMIWGHLFMGSALTFLSLIGFVALSGVVVNDSLILMQFYNERRSGGMPVHRAILESGRARARAILLTTITTVLGLLPLMLEKSFQARFLIPMAITISFGLMSATVLILLMLPCLLLIWDDIRRAVRFAWTGDVPPRGRVEEDLTDVWRGRPLSDAFATPPHAPPPESAASVPAPSG